MLAGVVAIGAAAGVYFFAGAIPPSTAAVSVQIHPAANRSSKADVEFYPNREAKEDRLGLTLERRYSMLPEEAPASRADILRASFDAFEKPPLHFTPTPYPVVPPTQAPRAPSLSDLRNPLLNDAQIASIKTRLKLTPAQEKLWPAVVAALHDVIRLHAKKTKEAKRGQTVTLDPASAELQRLRTAALPFLKGLREDQRREVQTLAHIIGLDTSLSRL